MSWFFLSHVFLVGIFWVISGSLQEEIGKPLRFRLLLLVLDACSSTSWLVQDPLALLPLVDALFDLKFCAVAGLNELSVLFIALASLFSRAFKVLQGQFSETSPTHCEITRNSLRLIRLSYDKKPALLVLPLLLSLLNRSFELHWSLFLTKLGFFNLHVKKFLGFSFSCLLLHLICHG